MLPTCQLEFTQERRGAAAALNGRPAQSCLLKHDPACPCAAMRQRAARAGRSRAPGCEKQSRVSSAPRQIRHFVVDALSASPALPHGVERFRREVSRSYDGRPFMYGHTRGRADLHRVGRGAPTDECSGAARRPPSTRRRRCSTQAFSIASRSPRRRARRGRPPISPSASLAVTTSSPGWWPGRSRRCSAGASATGTRSYVCGTMRPWITSRSRLSRETDRCHRMLQAQPIRSRGRAVAVACRLSTCLDRRTRCGGSLSTLAQCGRVVAFGFVLWL